MFTLCAYTFSKVPSPSLCEAVQRQLDAIDPRLVLQVEGTRARIVGPSVCSEPLPIMFAFVKAMRATDTLAEFGRRLKDIAKAVSL